ncbi:hypothetical protein FOA52_002887 [Chlamydomonas sp. UWO 241]|nr:hypothetical protein FOA52_002887 [Chlamydomonas sp. UWO 241]
MHTLTRTHTLTRMHTLTLTHTLTPTDVRSLITSTSTAARKRSGDGIDENVGGGKALANESGGGTLAFDFCKTIPCGPTAINLLVASPDRVNAMLDVFVVTFGGGQGIYTLKGPGMGGGKEDAVLAFESEEDAQRYVTRLQASPMRQEVSGVRSIKVRLAPRRLLRHARLPVPARVGGGSLLAPPEACLEVTDWERYEKYRRGPNFWVLEEHRSPGSSLAVPSRPGSPGRLRSPSRSGSTGGTGSPGRSGSPRLSMAGELAPPSRTGSFRRVSCASSSWGDLSGLNFMKVLDASPLAPRRGSAAMRRLTSVMREAGCSPSQVPSRLASGLSPAGRSPGGSVARGGGGGGAQAESPAAAGAYAGGLLLADDPESMLEAGRLERVRRWLEALLDDADDSSRG